MTAKNLNPFVNQLKTLNLQLDNDMIDGVDILKHTNKVSRKDAHNYLAEEAVDLIWFRDELANIEADSNEETTSQEILEKVQIVISRYFQLRVLESLRIRGEYDKTQAYIESAVLQQNPDYRKSMH